MSTAPAEIDRDTSPRRSFRYSLKALLLLVTLLCFWLGVNAWRNHRADEMASRRNAVYSTLLKNLTEPPPDTDIFSGIGTFDLALQSRGREWILANENSRGFDTEQLVLTLGPTLLKQPRTEVVHSIGKYMGRGLDKCGFNSHGGPTESLGDEACYLGHWEQYPNFEFTVIVEVVSEYGRRAKVWVGVIENQSLFDSSFPQLTATGWLLAFLLIWLAWLALGRTAEIILRIVSKKSTS